MREIITKTTVYSFSELSPEAKIKAIENYANSEFTQELNNNLFFKDTKEFFASEYGLEIELIYSLGYCQGDGLRFDCADLLSKTIVDKILKPNLNAFEIKLLQFAINSGHGITIADDERRGHHFPLRSDVEGFYWWRIYDEYKEAYPGTQKTEEDFQAIFEKIRGILIEWYFKECKAWERKGYDAIYYIPSEEEFEETADANGWEFTAEGGLY